jgi:hypothetical protein
MRHLLLQLVIMLWLGVFRSQGFLSTTAPAFRSTVIVQAKQQWEREIDESSRRNAKDIGMGEIAAGAVLGGLVLGPFGAYQQQQSGVFLLRGRLNREWQNRTFLTRE